MRSFITFVLLIFVLVSSHGSVVAGDLSPAEVLRKHYASIGPADKMQLLKTMFAGGMSSFESERPIVRGGGKAIVVSDPDNLYFMMDLNSREYPFEKIGIFGDKVSLPFITSGNRSILGNFLNEHSRIISDNLFCGAMSLRWINNVAANTKLRLSSAGTTKINERKAYAVEVAMGTSSGEFKVRLYFDAENFRHVRSVYRRNIPVRQITFGQQNELADGFMELTEDFSDFREVEGLTFPFDYKLKFNSNSGTQPVSVVWEIKVINYLFNQKLAPDFFSFEDKKIVP